MSSKRKRLFTVLLAWAPFVVFANLAAAPSAAKSTRAADTQERRLDPGDRVSVSNRFEFGSVSVTGWDGNTLQATATNEDGTGPVPVTMTSDPTDRRRVLVFTAPAERAQGGRRVRLEVKIPRDAELEPLYVPKAEAKVDDLGGPVDLRSDSGTIIVRRVRSVKARTASGEIRVTEVEGPVSLLTSSANTVIARVSGDITADAGSANLRIEDADGLINVTTTTGNLWVEHAGGDVRVVSINGRTNIRCAKGRVDVNDTSGVITLSAIEGDVDIMTSGGRASLIGTLRAGGHYRLKTLSGAVQMTVPEDASDFTATLSSYSGNIETDFASQDDSATHAVRGRRRIVSRYGDGRTQIELDAFNGRVRLSKISPNAIEKCER